MIDARAFDGDIKLILGIVLTALLVGVGLGLTGAAIIHRGIMDSQPACPEFAPPADGGATP